MQVQAGYSYSFIIDDGDERNSKIFVKVTFGKKYLCIDKLTSIRLLTINTKGSNYNEKNLNGIIVTKFSSWFFFQCFGCS